MRLRYLAFLGICVAVAACGRNAAPAVDTATGERSVARAGSPTPSPSPIPTSTPLFKIVDLAPPVDIQNLWTYADFVNDSGTAIGTNPYSAVEYKNGSVVTLPGIGGAPSVYDGGINASGDMSGTALDPMKVMHAVIWHTDGSMTVLDQGTSWSNTAGLGINDAGDVVGYGSPSHDNSHDGFLYAGGQISALPVPQGEQANGTYAISLNNAVVGAGVACCKPNAAAEFTATSAQIIRPPGAVWSAAAGINTMGHLAGTFNPTPIKTTTYRPFTFDGKTVHLLPYPTGDSGCYGNAINDSNFVVVSCLGGSYLYQNGVAANLLNLVPPNSGWTTLDARGISNNCIVVGAGTSQTGFVHAFEMIPLSGTCPASLPRLRQANLQ